MISAAANTFSAAAPQGTCGAQMAIVLSASAKSARPVILPGLPFGTAICSVFETKSTGAPAPPASVTVFMVAGLAAAKTSAGAPALIWVARVALDPKLKVTVLPEAVRKSAPIWVNASVSEAAANTVSGGAAVRAARGARSGVGGRGDHRRRPAAG